MNIHEIQIGQDAFVEKHFTEADVMHFADLSSDHNPVHLDASYAASTIFKQRIVHGFLVGSLISAVLGTQLPGPGCIYLGQTMKFVKPVYFQDVVRATVTVKAITPEKGIVVLETACSKLVDGEWELVITGEATVKLL